MLRKRLIALALIAASAGPAALAQQPAPTNGLDARCVLTMAALASQGTAAEKQVAQGGLMFYSGRIKARAPNADLSQLLVRAKHELTGKSVASEASRCLPPVGDAMRQLQAAQQALTTRR